jgi:HEAT repeat protein
MTDSSIVPRLALLFSLLALVASSASAAAGWRGQRRTAPAPPGAPPAADVDEIDRRVIGLERQVELVKAALAVRVAVPARGAPAAPVVAGPPAAEVADLAQRLVRLEQLAASIQGSRSGGRPLAPEAMAAATRTVLDRQISAPERAAALTLLRPSDGRADGRSHEVVVAALELIQAPETAPRLRAGMIRDLDKLKDPALKDPLVGILSRDPDGRTRREAVETLAVFYDDPQVRALVERLKDADPEAEVRAQAIKQLGRWQAR